MAALLSTLAGCETNAERSAHLAKLARHNVRAQTGLVITRQNPNVEVLATAVLHNENGTAAVVTLRNRSSKPLHDVPILITVRDARGSTLYTNGAPGLSPTLVSASLLPAHGELTWVDDQVQTTGIATKVGAEIGEAAPATGSIPRLSIAAAHMSEDATNGPGAEGTLVNHSDVTQQELVVYAIARRAGKIVAAGRAILPQALANASTQFQVFFIGSPHGASLQLEAPPSTLG